MDKRRQPKKSIPYKSIDQLLKMSLKTFIFLKTFNSKCFYSEALFTDQISKPLQTFLNLYISKDIGKNVSKTEEVNRLKIFLIMLNKVDLLQMRLKLLEKKQFIKLQKHLVI